MTADIAAVAARMQVPGGCVAGGRGVASPAPDPVAAYGFRPGHRAVGGPVLRLPGNDGGGVSASPIVSPVLGTRNSMATAAPFGGCGGRKVPAEAAPAYVDNVERVVDDEGSIDGTAGPAVSRCCSAVTEDGAPGPVAQVSGGVPPPPAAGGKAFGWAFPPAPSATVGWSLPLRRPPPGTVGAALPGPSSVPLPLADRPLMRISSRGSGGGGVGGGSGRGSRRGIGPAGGGGDKAGRQRRSRRKSRSKRSYVVLEEGMRALATSAPPPPVHRSVYHAVSAPLAATPCGSVEPGFGVVGMECGGEVAGAAPATIGTSRPYHAPPPTAAAPVLAAVASPRNVYDEEADALSDLPDEVFATAISSVLGRWIDANAHASGHRPPPASDDPLSQFFSSSRQPFTLLYYVRRLVTHTRCSRSAYVAAFVYLDRLAAVAPALAVRSMNVHRLLLSALVVAVKVLDDDVYSAAYYCRVGGIPSVGEYVALEATLLRLLGFRVAVGVDVYHAYEKGILRAAAGVGLSSGEGSVDGSGDSGGLE
ncbi:hypothetical protein BU14_0589s0006 [Porphyra umbilicalis]|uniref:Cyclin-like domain-containing protein n=1 Tax=Porphyra umbilicalis TaxID=2786 RepID=A0A1X6NRH4_PORUM|nr:hypothetical protein BU14_0589s0006 [Porphyra umbilicalis]|eukprot:OSX71130.1 hypothetical protein BU14_0589s0006 [Porphyra umbilicalis]